ncbi:MULTISPECIES: nuclear transport factor 2 family protein [unclassified Streptomyces]|uniref:nuclear transport factor 2 family protein n=1 Tax=unclassified Streptomyces TaxID=2593676 RepID=UPI00380863F4
MRSATPSSAAQSSAGRPTTLAVVRELLRRIGEGDPERIAELYAEPSDWKLAWPEDEHGRGRGATPWIRHRATRADAAAHFRELAGHHVPGEAATEIERVLVDGDDAVVFGEIRETARSTGRAYRARFALHLTVEGGLVTRHHVYEDSLAVARAFAPASGTPSGTGSGTDSGSAFGTA